MLITGGGSGIGQTTALAFAQSGARVVVSDRDAATGAETVRRIESEGGAALFVPCDVTQSDQVKTMVARAVEKFGRLDVAVNNAGIDGVRARTADYPESVWRDVIEVNLTGVFLCMQHELAQMVRQGSGSIVNLASVAGVTGFPGHAAYTASKHGVVGLTRTAALDYAKYGIRVNAVCPAYTTTPMVERMVSQMPGLEEKLKSRVPLGRLGRPEEIAQSIQYLCSSAGGFITGHSLVLDGGIMAE